MATRNYLPDEFFRRYHLPVISPDQNDSENGETNATGESQAEDKPVKENMPPKYPFCPPSCLLFSVSGLSFARPLSRLGELHVKAGYVSTLLAG